ncbi:YhgE/Pip domain-containing protein [Paenibacillus protaetiae]|uniref:DUF3533 domain-containing protein n=1 Tax=Paenibacillus protaetiae TaxID=2509456 RepID=A0A4P6EW24_9BACL|nr:ABC transporter permease [Paenibacillus protaetiae]QAY66876.1 DUF3533 domain-containing protein [Paenibacillus protaetiae]
MKQVVKAFMSKPTTMVGIITALMFQIIFSVIWMTAYDGVTDRAKQLHIAVVNEDKQFGTQIADKLVKELPFKMVGLTDLEQAKSELNNRDLQMIVYLPEGFTQQASAADGKAAIQYWVNESNPAMIKSIMTGVADQITAEVNKQAVAVGVQSALSSTIQNTDQAASAGNALSERVTSELHSMNVVQGMNNQMVPMMMVLASFVGAMIMGMNLEQSTMMVRAQAGRWQIFGVKAVLNIVSAVVVSLVGVSFVTILGGQIDHSQFFQMWMFQGLFLLVFMFVSQMFLSLIGMPGMLFNIMLLSAQLVSSGAIVPRELLSGFYSDLGTLLPATYAVEGIMNVLFGGSSIGGEAGALAVIMAVAVAVTVAAIALKKQTAPKGAPQHAQLESTQQA